MKFFQIATASFLAGNAVVAAYEIPSDNLIAELADEYNAELSNFLDFDEAKCMSVGEGIEQCISGKLAEDAEWASSMEKAVMTAEPCLVDAMAKGDAEKIVKCALPVLDITDKYCSTAAFREACGMAPSMIEDFVLNLVEVLKVAAVWEDKFIAKTNLKERLSNFFDEAKCMSEGDGIAQCVSDELGKDAEWTSSVEQAVATAEPCFVKAVAEWDTAKAFDCVRLVWDVADKYCSTESARKACDPSSSSSSDGYGLRGSSSFNEEADEDVDWVKVKCEAEQSKAKWRAEMEKSTGQAKLHAQKRYEEAKAAALRAEARFTPAAKEAWEKVKAAHDETWEGAKKWWDRHFGDVSDFEYGEDEFDVQC